MSGQWGNYLRVSIYGESHGPAIGITIDGLPSGLPLDLDAIAFEMARRAPGRNSLSTQRQEADTPRILSGLYTGKSWICSVRGMPIIPGMYGMADLRTIMAGDIFLDGSPHPWYFVGRSANRSCAAMGLTSTPMWLPLGGFRTRGFWMCQRGIPACQSWQRRCCPCWIQPNGSPWNRRLTLPAWRGIP